MATETELLRDLVDELREMMVRWADLAPPDDWGADMVDTVLSDVGRGLLEKIDQTLATIKAGEQDAQE